MSASLLSALPDFSACRILVLGDVMLDRYWTGSTQRISPEAPVPVVNIGPSEDRAGGAANVALNVRALGAQVTLMGLCGTDDHGDQLESILQQAQVSTKLIRCAHPTITKLRVMSRHQQLIRLDFEHTDWPEAVYATLLEKFSEIIHQQDIVIFSDYAKGTLNQVELFIAYARKHSIPTLVDPKGQDFQRYRGATLLTPNAHEFALVAGKWTDTKDLEKRAKEWTQQLDLSALLVTRGEHGMTFVEKTGASMSLPTVAKEVFDVTGAGDTVIATLATVWSATQDWRQSVRLANLAAGIVVGKVGTATVSRDELSRSIRPLRSQGGIISAEELVEIVEDLKAQGKKIVFTNGCFDILHAGHVHYLDQAQSLGDVLIVAVNSDESVQRLKGLTRPINSLQNRMTVLSGLRAVDWVTSFSNDTPKELIELLTPNILVKGGDYQEENIVGTEWVKSHGGKVKTIPFVDGCSTTLTIQKIAQQKY
ncbi:MAG: bifunctional D-glycero-beta-D-manno-heptose-7-phosphate kinase/D-glycero-beta-D-manno-heptose 1-phosphate adenylyltransferase HldE [Pseudomonadota bacterium]